MLRVAVRTWNRANLRAQITTHRGVRVACHPRYWLFAALTRKAEVPLAWNDLRSHSQAYSRPQRIADPGKSETGEESLSLARLLECDGDFAGSQIDNLKGESLAGFDFQD
jgi:hypothetical protein